MAHYWNLFMSHMSSQAPSSPPRETFRNPSPHQFPLHTAKILRTNPISASAHIVQLAVDVSGSNLNQMYTTPGQFVRLVFPDCDQPLLAVIASPPDIHSTTFHFILSAKHHRKHLRQAERHQTVAVSNIMGKGMSINLQRGSNLHIFVDTLHGFAALNALLESASFRASTGEGCNRTSFTTIYAAVPSVSSIPYIRKFSQWIAYGVTVIPIVAQNLVEYVSATSLGTHAELCTDHALICVAQEETMNALSKLLMLSSFRQSSLHRFSLRDVVESASQRTPTPSQQDTLSSTMPESTYNDFMRAKFEKCVWDSWVGVREEMRQEFEKKWAAQSRLYRDERASERDKTNAWASWAARNAEQWKKVEWDGISWGQYWKSWDDKRSKWKGEKTWTNSSQKTWSQTRSQEYWDWVQTGVGKGASTGASNNWSSSSSQQYGSSSWNSSTGWSDGAWSGYQKGGYRYEYEQTEKDRQQRSYRDYQRYGSSGSSRGSSSGQSWNGWNNNSSRRGSASTGGGVDMDFYGLLGIQRGASRAEIKKAYRKMAMEHHPDRNPDNVDKAHTKMKQIVVAWTVLKDDEKRRRYDSYGVSGL